MTLDTVTVDLLLDVEVMGTGSIMVVAIPMDEEGADLRPMEEEEEEGVDRRLEDRSEDLHLRDLDIWTMLNREEAMIDQGMLVVHQDVTMHHEPGHRHHLKSIGHLLSVLEEILQMDMLLTLLEDLITMNDPSIDTMPGNEELLHQITTGILIALDEDLSVNDSLQLSKSEDTNMST